MEETIIILLGLIFGSFANVVIYRLPRGESVVFPASRCPDCGHPLGPRDLIPGLSWLWLRGRCRNCGARISPRYPLVEGMMALLFLLVMLRWGWSFMAMTGCLLGFVLLCAALIDLDLGIIPDRLTMPALGAGLGLAFFTGGIGPALVGATGMAGLFLLLALLFEDGMGGGDIKLAGVIGAFCGWPGTMMTLILVAILSGLVLLFLLWRGGIKARTPVPFGPVLSLAGFLAYNYGAEWYMAYLSFFSRMLF